MNIKKEIERLHELEKIINNYEGCNIDVNVEIDVEKIDEIIKYHTINLLKALEIKGADISNFQTCNPEIMKSYISIYNWNHSGVESITLENKGETIFRIKKED